MTLMSKLTTADDLPGSPLPSPLPYVLPCLRPRRQLRQVATAAAAAAVAIDAQRGKKKLFTLHCAAK